MRSMLDANSASYPCGSQDVHDIRVDEDTPLPPTPFDRATNNWKHIKEFDDQPGSSWDPSEVALTSSICVAAWFTSSSRLFLISTCGMASLR